MDLRHLVSVEVEITKLCLTVELKRPWSSETVGLFVR